MVRSGGDPSREFKPALTWSRRAIALAVALLLQLCVFRVLAPRPTADTVSSNDARDVLVGVLRVLSPRRARTLPSRRARTLPNLSRTSLHMIRRTALVPSPLARGSAVQMVHSGQNLQGLAHALFGCGPGAALLLRTRPQPCSSLASVGWTGSAPAVDEGRPRAKHALRWALALAHERSPLLLPGALLAPLFYLEAVVSGSILDKDSLARDTARWPTYLSAERFLSASPPAYGSIPTRSAEPQTLAPTPPRANTRASKHFEPKTGD